MGYCKQCKTTILDQTEVCPLCHCVLEDDGEHRNMYPDIQTKDKKITIAIRIFVFFAIVTEFVLAYVNYRTYSGMLWCLIPGGALLLCYLTLKILVEYEYSYRSKTLLMVFFVFLYVLMIDLVTGFQRWSINYVFPIAIIAIDVLVLILMQINYRNWQSYMSWQIFTIALSVVALLLYRFHVLTSYTLSFWALVCSVLLFLGTLIIGGRRAAVELKRKFHII